MGQPSSKSESVEGTRISDNKTTELNNLVSSCSFLLFCILWHSFILVVYLCLHLYSQEKELRKIFTFFFKIITTTLEEQKPVMMASEITPKDGKIDLPVSSFRFSLSSI